VINYSARLNVRSIVNSVSDRDDISRKFFRNITMSTSCLHRLLLDQKMESHNSRLRSYKKFSRVYTRTKWHR